MKKIIITTTKTITFFGMWIALIGFSTIPTLSEIPNSSPALQRFWWEFVPLCITIVITLIALLLEKKQISIIISKHWTKDIVGGTFFGIIWIGIVIGILLLFNIIEIHTLNNLPQFFIWILALLLNVVMQELLIRGYLFQLFKKQYNFVIATVITTLIFLLLHAGAFEAGWIAVLNVVSMSILMSILLEYTEGLLVPIIAHFIWNFIGGIIFGGILLADDYLNLINVTFTGPSILSGGIYMLEGSVVVLIINIALICLIIYFYYRKMWKSLKD